MKKQILKKLNQIAKIAKVSGVEGKLSVSFSGCSVKEFDEAVESITEFERYRNNVQIAPKLSVNIILD